MNDRMIHLILTKAQAAVLLKHLHAQPTYIEESTFDSVRYGLMAQLEAQLEGDVYDNSFGE